MAVYTFFNQASAPSFTANANSNINVGMAFTPYANGTVDAISFYKAAADTGAHTGRVWQESNQALLGSILFSGETASGWQTMALAPAVAVVAGQRYRVTVSRVNASWASLASGFAGVQMGSIAVMDVNGYYLTASQSGYPATVNSTGVTYYVDISLNTSLTLSTAMDVSQVLGETWLSPISQTVVSQILAETWIAQVPPTALCVSQLLVEAWVPTDPALLSVPYRPLRVSSSVI